MTDLRKVENIQKRALKIVFDDYSATYLQLRQKGDRPLLYVERLRSIAIEMFKIYHSIGPKYLSKLVEKTDRKYKTGLVKPVCLPYVTNIKYGRNSFKYDGAYVWNSLPNNIKNGCTAKEFKSLIKSWPGPNCTCSYGNVCKLTNL